MTESCNMRKLLLSLAATVACAAASAVTPAVRDVDIKVLLSNDGTALVTENWDVTVSRGTEWYLVRDNLGDIGISGLAVSENGRDFINEGEWDVNRTIDEKAGKCGLVTKDNGCEICWGVGSYGNHTFTVSYLMSNAAKALDDYDIFHIQLVSPGLSSPPQHVRAEISLEGARADSTNARIWGFGFYGYASISPVGSVVLESSEPFGGDSSLIALLRLEKGVIHPTSVRHTTFSQVEKQAFKGSAYKRDRDDFRMRICKWASGILVLAACILISIRLQRKRMMNILGLSRKKDVSWSRDIPYSGNLAASDFILGQMGERRSGNNVASAMILRMIQKGCLSVNNDEKGKIEIAFGNEETLSQFGASERKLWGFMKEASGSDEILQSKEFSRWSAKHTDRINSWLTELSAEGARNIGERGFKRHGKYTAEGQAEARKALGLKKFLSEFTLIKERVAREAVIWQDYLVFGAMFGIADKVAAELKDINPTMFREAAMYDYTTTRGIIRMSNGLANSITNANISYHTDQMSRDSIKGFGGRTSFGGGGGFSSGGFGGGSR